MNRLTKLLSAKSGRCQSSFVGGVFGLIIMCCSASALADSVVEPEALAWMDVQTEAITDAGLSVINGKGGVLTKLDVNDRLAVILWDEGGSGNQRTSNHGADNRQGFQSVHLTVNRR